MKKKQLFAVSAAVVSVSLLFTSCHNSRFDRFYEKDTTSPVILETSKTEPEKESVANDNQESDTPPENLSDPAEVTASQTDFDNLLNDIYTDSMSYSLVTTHFDLMNPENFGISEYEHIWGECSADLYEDSYEEDLLLYQKLQDINYNNLTYDQQLTYDTLDAYLENSLELNKYYYLSENFSPSSGIQFSLPLILSEYALWDKQDVDDYLIVLESCDEYINEILEYEVWRGENGYALSDASLDEAISQCQDILSSPTPAFVPVICDSINQCDFLSEQEKASYTEKIPVIAQENFVPAINNIINTLSSLKGKRAVEGGLCNYENGTEYYRELVRLYTGSDKSIEELIDVIDEEIDECMNITRQVYMSNPHIFDMIQSDLEYARTEPEAIISYLTEKLTEYFPEPATEKYTLKSVAKSMESSSNPAYYIIPPYDNYERNIIYVNGSDEYADMDLFPTLAHEGLPGHMYQNNYFLSLNPHPVRTLLSFGGYSEGWAKYTENFSYRWSGLDEDVATLLEINDYYGFAIYSRMDIGINYEGWTIDNLTSYLQQCGLDVSVAPELYELFINDPASYLQYYFGRTEIIELRDIAMDELDNDFELIDFHEFILEVGPTYFDIIEDRLYMWIDEQK